MADQSKHDTLNNDDEPNHLLAGSEHLEEFCQGSIIFQCLQMIGDIPRTFLRVSALLACRPKPCNPFGQGSMQHLVKSVTPYRRCREPRCEKSAHHRILSIGVCDGM